MVGEERYHLDGPGKLLAARLSCAVLEILDTAAPTYFDDCFPASERLQNKLERRIQEEVIRFLDE